MKAEGNCPQALDAQIVGKFRPSQEFEAKQLIKDIYSENEDEKSFYSHVRRNTTSVVMTCTYGRRVPTWACCHLKAFPFHRYFLQQDCEDIHKVYGAMKEFSEASAPGTFVADLIPPLASIPTLMRWWKQRALAYQGRKPGSG